MAFDIPNTFMPELENEDVDEVVPPVDTQLPAGCRSRDGECAAARVTDFNHLAGTFASGVQGPRMEREVVWSAYALTVPTVPNIPRGAV